MKKFFSFLMFCCLITSQAIYSQVSVNATGNAPDPSAILDVQASDKGFLVPRMTLSQRDDISNPAKGLLVFCTDDNQFYYNQGNPSSTDWRMLGSQWLNNGSDINFTGGNVGIGISEPSYLLHVGGGDVKIGNSAGDARKLFFGDGTGVYIGEETTDNRLGLSGNTLTLKIGGTAGTPGQILTSDGNTCHWMKPPSSDTSSVFGTGTTDYLARWLSSNTLDIGIIRDDSSCVGINMAPDPNYRLSVDGNSTATAVYGRYDANRYGFLGGANFGVFGQYNETIKGYLGGEYGVYGEYGTTTAGYLGGSIVGAYGSHSEGGGAGHAGVYGVNTAEAVWSPGVLGSNLALNFGTDYALNHSYNGTVGYADCGTAYHFGVFGSRNDDDGGPSAGVIGSIKYYDGSKPWGALGFQDASSVEYAGYFSGNLKLTGGIHDGSGYGTAGNVLMSNGSNDVYWSAIEGISGSGTSNYLSKWSGATTLSNSQLYDNGTNIGLGTLTPHGKFQFGNFINNRVIVLYENTDNDHNYYGFGINSGTLRYQVDVTSSNHIFYAGSSPTSSVELMRIQGNGKVGIGIASPSAKLTVNSAGGSTCVLGQFNSDIQGSLASSTYGAYGQYNSSIAGYLGGFEYGAYGQYNASIAGYLGGASLGAYGQNGTKNGHLGGPDYGAYGRFSASIYGYIGGANYSVYGMHYTTGNATAFFDHYGNPASYTRQWAVEGYMVNGTGNDGNSYAENGNNSGCIRGYNYNGATYTFGVAGWNNNIDNRCAGVFGARSDGVHWGALGYKDSGNTGYGGYFSSYSSGTGKMANADTFEGIGIGAWGGLMGADIHGGIYGMYVEGENFGLYSKGIIYTDKPVIQLQESGGRERTPLYSATSTDAAVMISGQGKLEDGHCEISFDDNFKNVISEVTPLIITVTPMGPTGGVYIASSGKDGFSVSENNNGRSNCMFSYIVIGKRAGYENPQLDKEILAATFEPAMKEGLHDDSDKSSNGKGLSYKNGRLMIGDHPGSEKAGNK